MFDKIETWKKIRLKKFKLNCTYNFSVCIIKEFLNVFSFGSGSESGPILIDIIV